MSHETIKGLVGDCADAADATRLWSVVVTFFYSRHIDMVSYHLEDTGELPGGCLGFVEDGFPEEWVCEYINSNLRVSDPIPGLAEKLSRPFLWSEIEALGDLSETETDFMQRRKKSRIGEGLALPTFGPKGRNAYFGLGFGTPRYHPDKKQIFELQCAAQIAHLRFCELIEPVRKRVELSPRELEILRWMARGKSNSVIAEILGISRHTVDTMGRRLFEKLDVNDRTTAAIKGLGSGLLRIKDMDVV
ncbi:HTH-type quorum sensing-dependent transcriptional regulator VjbR [Sulfitobacter sp. THAF37]|uniref:helix-turn-helix transcriptional regulator n=1 Tax=Sulfitobacter sp. THAF37 TaxID=2587855 RepID=UPI0012684B32|nr:LuxR family transcriptional regulator [Sulfitobacter sp. THAF37]QFT57400.1 HTH-type quorum sensing-dependent transcriptional regulator VjbR [Sulfitobacter sp. THAF37]